MKYRTYPETTLHPDNLGELHSTFQYLENKN